ncbi:hypothetical protein AAC387_Pa01g1059 [Persea americana]
MACALSPPSFSPFLRSPSSVRARSLSVRVSATCTSAEPAATSSLYQVLGVPRGATCQEIKAAYRRLARIWHPDAVASDQRDTSADEFMKLHAAYSTLSDPEKRADYDRKLLQRPRPRPFPSTASSYYSSSSSSSFKRASSFGGYGRRTWETDQCW